MVVMKQFWTPCYWYADIKSAVKTIAFYTMIASVIFITYTCYVMNGGESSQFYMPYFEADRETTLPIVGSLAIVFLVCLFFASLAVVRGVNIDHRGLIIPWLLLVGAVIAYQAWLGLWQLYAYYIYLDIVLVVLINWIWMSYNIYCWLAIYSMYQEIKIKQSPNLDLLYN